MKIFLTECHFRKINVVVVKCGTVRRGELEGKEITYRANDMVHIRDTKSFELRC